MRRGSRTLSLTESADSEHETTQVNVGGAAPSVRLDLDRDETTTITSNLLERSTAPGDDATLPSFAVNSVWDQGSYSDDDDDDETETVPSTVVDASTVASGFTEGERGRHGQRHRSSSATFHVYRLDPSGQNKELVKPIEEGEESQEGSEADKAAEPEQHPHVAPHPPPHKRRQQRLVFLLCTVLCLLFLVFLAVAIGVVSGLVSSTKNDKDASTERVGDLAPTSSPTQNALVGIQNTIVQAMRQIDEDAGDQTHQSFQDESSRQSLVARWLADTDLELRRQTSQLLYRFGIGLCFLEPLDLLVDSYKDGADVCTWYIDDDLTGVECLKHPYPDAFTFDNSPIAGTIPPELSLLRGLERISMDRNKLFGTVPPVLAKSLVNLNNLLLDHNKLSGSFPPFASLKFLYLNNNRFTSLPNVTQPLLEHMTARENNFTRTLDQYVAPAPRLSFLDLSQNKIEGTIPASHLCTSCPRIQLLRLGDNKLTGTVPAEIFSQCKNLELLFLERNKLSGLELPPFASSSVFAHLRLSGNRLSGPLPFLRQELPPKLNLLILSQNKFSGPLQPRYGTQIKVLKLDKNWLTGTLPEAYLNGTLEVLTVASNRLTGTIPVVENTNKLDQLDLSNNKFRGPLPQVLIPNAQVSELSFLNVSNNALTGTLPAPLLDDRPFLPQRAPTMDVSFNQLTGTIPPEFGRVKRLTMLSLHDNAGINGTVPETFVNLRDLRVFDIRHTNITGSVEFLCFCSVIMRVDCERVDCTCCECSA